MSAKSIVWFLPVLMLTGAVFAQGVDPGTQNLTHSWTFKDGTANDAVGGANGTLMGDAEIFDGSLIVADQGQWMEMPGNVIALDTYDEITLEAWYLPYEGVNTGYTMLAYFGDISAEGSGSNGLFLTAARGDNKSRVAITIGMETSPYTAESGADGPEYDDGLLHHMVGTLTADSIKLYVDGVLTGANALSATNGIWGISENYAFLAKSGYTADAQWIGEIEEFNIYNKALSADEVLFQFNRQPSTAVGQAASAAIPAEFGLSQNHPNPFNPATVISFDLPRQSKVRIAVHDGFGRKVAGLVDGVRAAGRHTVQFDGTNLSSGLYLCRMEIDGRVFTRKMTLLK
jgi:hypothetical protein